MAKTGASTREKKMSRRAAIFVGLAVAGVGLLLLVLSLSIPQAKLETPRWILASVGGAFLAFGGWTAGAYFAGYDPERPNARLPSPAVQLAVFLPGMLCFAVPFHWIAFGRGPREFDMSFSLPFLSQGSRAPDWMGRGLFGAGAVLLDVLIVAMTVTLARRMVRGR
jgi:hypothetical protein